MNHLFSASRKAFWAGFRDGVSQPSKNALFGGVFLAAVFFAIAALRLTEQRVAAAPAGAWMMDGADDYGRITSLAMRGGGCFSNGLSVFILGASDTREMLAAEAELGGIAREQGDSSVRFISLCADGLLLEERAAILDRLQPSSPGVVVLGINLWQFCRPASDLTLVSEHYRLGFRSGVFDEEAALAGVSMPKPTGLYFYDNRWFFLRHLGCALPWRGVVGYVPHRAQGGMAPDGDPWQFRRVHHFSPGDFQRHCELISRMAARLKKAGSPPLVLLEIPSTDYLDPALGGPSHAQELRLYRSAVEEFARRSGLAYIDPTPASGLAPRQFVDYAHLGDDAARLRFSTEFIRQLKPFLPASRS